MALLLTTLGGASEVVGQIGHIVGGQAAALMALAVGKLPLLDAVAARRRPGPFHLALFAVVLLVTMLSSRFLALFMLLQVGMVWNYRRAETGRRWLALRA